jgi:hypothetical protein
MHEKPLEEKIFFAKKQILETIKFTWFGAQSRQLKD